MNRNFIITLICISLFFSINYELTSFNKKTDIHKRDNNGNTPLHKAALQGDIKSLKTLIRKGADPYALNNEGQTPFFIAAYKGNINVMEELLNLGIDINHKNPWKDNALEYAVNGFKFDSIKYLVKKGIDINSRSGSGLTILHKCATDNCYLEFFKYFVSNGANINIRTEFEFSVKINDITTVYPANSTPLDFAKISGSEKIIEFITSYLKSTI